MGTLSLALSHMNSHTPLDYGTILRGRNGDTAYLMWNGSEKLDKDEARWLNKSPYFNRGFTAKTPPRTARVHAFQAFNTDGTDFISLKIDVEGTNPLYQAQAFRSTDHCVLSWSELTGRSDTAEFMIRKSDILSDNTVFLQFIDSRGSQSLHDHPLTVPLHIQETQPIPTIEDNVIHLTLTSKHSKAIVPMNRSWQWGEHLTGDSVWEKTPEGDTPPIPNDFVSPWYIPNFPGERAFFYAHANSLIVWDTSEITHNVVDTHLYLPNPCGDIAAFEVLFLADHKEVYKIEEARVRDQGTHISFEIPEDTKTLQLEVFDLGEPACDHYILTNPTLRHSDTYSAPSLYRRKIATTWGNLKRGN